MAKDDKPFRVVFYNPYHSGIAPGQAYLDSCPEKIRARLLTTLVEISKAPPYKFRGGGLWEAMKGSMTGWFEVRISSGKTNHYRVYCVLDEKALNFSESLLVVVDGRTKKYLTTLSPSEYEKIRRLGESYFSVNPRLI